jgi:hypothetical protein
MTTQQQETLNINRYEMVYDIQWFAIMTINDVVDFFNKLKSEGTYFHPDDDFNDYTTPDGKPSFTQEEAEFLNNRMARCHEVCRRKNADIYALAIKPTRRRESQLEEFKFSVANWTKFGTIRTSHPTVKAKDMESAVRKIERRFPNAYDISTI